jgi:uncharacterized protein YgbK (DUF1537 family)
LTAPAPSIESLLPFATPPRRVSAGARQTTRERLRESGTRLVVLDDDPTGTQTVHDVPVYLDWSPESVAGALREESQVVYISTNSRALDREAACELGRTLGRRLRRAEQETGRRALLASRSDSTLRGHYPAEVDALLEGHAGPVDGVIICPAFFEGGRYTAGDVHYVLQESVLTPAAETEFARDPIFGYSRSDLREWVVEKAGRGLCLEEVLSIPLEVSRQGGPEAICKLLMGVSGGAPVVMNAVCYEDLDQLVLGLTAAESQGKRFVYRCAASFVKARGGIEDRPLLAREELGSHSPPGLVMVGSWVERTNSQLVFLLQQPGVTGVEVDARAAASDDAAARSSMVEDVIAAVERALRGGSTAAVYTSRRLASAEDGSFSEVGRRIMAALCEVVERLDAGPRFVVAKGGITSVEIARSALRARRATVLGQIADGVPVWRLDAGSKWADLPYVVFPGNVGTESTLRDVVMALEGRG